MKQYFAPDFTAILWNRMDVLTATGDNWSNQPDWQDDPTDPGGVDAGGQLEDDFWN